MFNQRKNIDLFWTFIFYSKVTPTKPESECMFASDVLRMHLEKDLKTKWRAKLQACIWNDAPN